MGRIVMAVITVGIIGYIGYKQMYGRSVGSIDSGAPKQRLENVQKAANRIEDQQQKSADSAYEKSEKAEGN
jgi:hypothetical protein